jgi:hypothetical protein
MKRRLQTFGRGFGPAVLLALAGPAAAQETTFSTAPLPYGPPPGGPPPPGEPPPPPAPVADGQPEVAYAPPPIPPAAEAQPLAGPGGSFCYAGPHPVDTRVAAGAAWDDAQGPHTHFYPPFDPRLFALHNGCYHFVGDPVDFGYRGQTYSYYGAHPVLDGHGGGWCFMIGGHAHAWRPWSRHFVVVGTWNYWQGPYDQYFWSYWPYYSHYYRSYYPHYYGGGRFGRGRGAHVAPRIDRVPARYPRRPEWRATPPPAAPAVGERHIGRRGDSRGGWSGHGNGGGWTGGPPATVAPTPSPARPMRHGSPGAARGGWSGHGGGWSGGAPAGRGTVPSAAAPSGGQGGGGARIGATRGGWRN